MPRFILRAPDAHLRYSEDYRHQWQEFSYTETVDVINGIAKCNDETTKHMLVGKGYVLLDPKLGCKECEFFALDMKEFKEHEKKHIKRKPRL